MTLYPEIKINGTQEHNVYSFVCTESAIWFCWNEQSTFWPHLFG